MKTPEQGEYDILKTFLTERKIEIKLPRVSDLFDKYEKDLGDFGVNPWGSCQYHSAWVTYEFCRDLIKELGLPNFKALVGIPEFPLKPLEQILDSLAAELESYNRDTEETEEDPDEFIMDIEDPFTFASWARATRNASWDLLSAYISFWYIYQLPEGFDPNTYEIPLSVQGVGPILNQLCQKENPRIGLSAAIIQAEFPDHFNPMDWADYDT